MVTLSQGKDILFGNIDEWFTSHGYCFKNRGEGKYLKDTGSWIYAIEFNFFKKNANHFNSTVRMHSKIVESIILECGVPDINLDSYKKGHNLLFTLHDGENLKSYMSKMRAIDLSDEDGFLEWSRLILSYMAEGATCFIDKYSYIPNILGTIRQIEAKGQRNYLELIEGGIDHLFRVLIISKLCGDDGYEARKNRFEELILQPKYSMWHSHFESLKRILEETLPLTRDKMY